MPKHNYKMDWVFFVLSVIVTIVFFLLPQMNWFLIIVLSIVGYGLSVCIIIRLINKTSFRVYLSVVVLLFFCLLGYSRWPSSEVTKTFSSKPLRTEGGSLKVSTFSNPFSVCINHPVENSGIKISVLKVKNEDDETIIERVIALFGKHPPKTKQVIYGTISAIDGSELKKFSSVEVGTCMTYHEHYSVRVTGISIDSQCAKLTVANGEKPCE
jgi:hypothetical protein